MVFVLSDTSKKLMPTSSYRARKLLKAGKATIYKYRPFTIKLTQRSDGDTQPIEYCCDTGYQHVGISIKSEKNEFVNEQGDLLADETERQDGRTEKARQCVKTDLLQASATGGMYISSFLGCTRQYARSQAEHLKWGSSIRRY